RETLLATDPEPQHEEEEDEEDDFDEPEEEEPVAREPEVVATIAPAGDGRGRAPAASALVELLLKDERARRVGDAIVAFDCGEGRNVSVVVGERTVTLSAVREDERVYDEEHDEWNEDDGVNEAVDAVARDVLEELQRVTGWHVDSDYEGF